MTIREERRDLFEVPQGYYLAHCISKDMVLGAGIAKQFDEVFNLKERLHMWFDPNLIKIGGALVVGNVISLTTKEKAFEQPSYEALRDSLESMRDALLFHKIKKVAMPRIGCGLDRLDWFVVKNMIKEVFGKTDVDILICYL